MVQLRAPNPGPKSTSKPEHDHVTDVVTLNSSEVQW